MNQSNSKEKSRDRYIKKDAHKELKDSPKAERLRMFKEDKIRQKQDLDDLKTIEQQAKEAIIKKKTKKK